MTPHELAPSHQAGMVAIYVSYGLLILAAVLLAVTGRKHREPEQLYFLKLLGYMVLSIIMFRVNGWALPIGLLLAFLMLRRAAVNRRIKGTAVLLGAIFFLFSLYPLQERIDRLLDPPHRMSTYLDDRIHSGERGFNMTVLDDQYKIRLSLNEQNADAVALYEALAGSRTIEAVPAGWQAAATIELRQNHAQIRFNELQYQFDREGRYLTLYNGAGTYSFESSDAFRAIFRKLIVSEVS
ncbi:hypothetical protein [Paenibacillus silvisoli]|uniref:hypothetical protein n=1 Tax=Paenibacillus silvisoli TaxID=3110539 RepID=UPI002805A6FA|nr:hypothetical protein [Paenibacillus silvisoli]